MSAAVQAGTRRPLKKRRTPIAGRPGMHFRLSLAVTAFCASAFMSAPAVASDVPMLLTQKRCNACHDLTEARIGPPYSAIAVRHRADKSTMAEVLARKIVLGGGGNWGLVPMVPNEHVTIDEALTMARWILEIQTP